MAKGPCRKCKETILYTQEKVECDNRRELRVQVTQGVAGRRAATYSRRQSAEHAETMCNGTQDDQDVEYLMAGEPEIEASGCEDLGNACLKMREAVNT